MATFLNTIVSAHAATVFVLLLICLNYGYPGFKDRAVNNNFFWLLWFLAAVICLIAWIKLVFGV